MILDSVTLTISMNHHSPTRFWQSPNLSPCTTPRFPNPGSEHNRQPRGACVHCPAGSKLGGATQLAQWNSHQTRAQTHPSSGGPGCKYNSGAAFPSHPVSVETRTLWLGASAPPLLLRRDNFKAGCPQNHMCPVSGEPALVMAVTLADTTR